MSDDTLTIVLYDTEPFELGETFATPGAIEVLENLGISPISLIQRHLNCDWAELPKEDREINYRAVQDGDGRIFSSYTVAENTKVWVITEADRSATTVLLPSEY